MSGISMLTLLVLAAGPDSLAGVLFRPERYLDPGSGSYLLQLLIGGILGGFFVVRMSWSRIKAFFGRLFSRKKDAPGDESS